MVCANVGSGRLYWRQVIGAMNRWKHKNPVRTKTEKKKEKQFVENLFKNGGNQTKAVLEMEPNRTYFGAAHEGSRLAKLIKKDIRETFDEIGLTDTRIGEVLRDGMEAAKVISAKVFPDGRDGMPVDDFIEVPDWNSRLRAAEVAAKIKGLIGRKDDAPTVNNFVVVRGEPDVVINGSQSSIHKD